MDTPPIVASQEWEAARPRRARRRAPHFEPGVSGWPEHACRGCSMIADHVSNVAHLTWSYPDITALGRQEGWEDSPEGYPRTPPYVWWNWHDAYEKGNE